MSTKNYRVSLIAVLLVAQAPIYIPAHSFSSLEKSGGNVHGDITREALHDTISDTNLNFLIKAGESQDTPGGEGAVEARRHFDNSSFGAALAYLDREKKMALNYAADADQDSQNRTQCLRHLGLMLHTAQDFYSRSNYVELQLEDGAKRRDPLNIELVDWNKIPDGYIGKSSGTHLTSGSLTSDPNNTTPASYQQLNKDTAASAEGQKTVGGYSYFQIAKELAVKETQRQWNWFATLVQGRYRDRAAAILAALKSASVPSGETPDSAPDLVEP